MIMSRIRNKVIFIFSYFIKPDQNDRQALPNQVSLKLACHD